MFSFLSKSFLGKKKICLRVEDSTWSEPFPVDTIGDTGRSESTVIKSHL